MFKFLKLQNKKTKATFGNNYFFQTFKLVVFATKTSPLFYKIPIASFTLIGLIVIVVLLYKVIKMINVSFPTSSSWKHIELI